MQLPEFVIDILFVWNTSFLNKMEGMNSLREHTQIWEKIAPQGSFDTRACHFFIMKLGGPPISAGKQCISFLTDHLQEILEKLESKMDSSTAFEKEAEPVNLEPSLVAESTPDYPEDPPKPLPLIDQCEFSLEAEALERLKACVQACFKTDRGIILLENELLLYEDVEESYRDTWFTETCEAWKDRLHSSLSEEFCSALGLWMVSKQSN